jgi:glutaconate CoA-transferase subunit B
MPVLTNTQMMAVALARQIKDGMTCIIGTGLPLIGATIAKYTTAPNAMLVFESGIIDGNPQELPTSVSYLRIARGASDLWPEYRYLGFQNNAYKKHQIDLGFLGGAQIDPFGNLNSTCVGDYWHPQARFTGSGGANGIATNVNTVIIMKHEKRRFCEKVDYITSPGWIDGPEGRRKLGLPEVGPQALVTDLGIMRFDEETRRLYLAEYFPGVTPQQVLENTGFDMDISRAVESPPPSNDTLAVLQKLLDHPAFAKHEH